MRPPGPTQARCRPPPALAACGRPRPAPARGPSSRARPRPRRGAAVSSPASQARTDARPTAGGGAGPTSRLDDDGAAPSSSSPHLPLAAPATLLLLDAIACAAFPATAHAALAPPTLTAPAVLDFLLHHPVAAAAFAGAAVWGVPRAVRLLTKAVVLPLAVVAGVALVASAPHAAAGAVAAAAAFASSHPVLVSAVILGGAGLVLSPYLLLAGLAAALAFGLPRLPGPLRPALPAPVVEAERTVAALTDAGRAALRPALSLADQLRGEVSARAGAALDAATAPGRAAADAAGRVGAAVAGVATRVEAAASRVEATAAEATACRSRPTPAERAACVRAQNERAGDE